MKSERAGKEHSEKRRSLAPADRSKGSQKRKEDPL